MFAEGDLIIYGGEGVCRVEKIGIPAISGVDRSRQYYYLSPLYRTGKVFTPVDTKVRMRPVLDRKAALALIRQIPDMKAEAAPIQNVRALKEYYQTAVSTCVCEDLVKLIKTAYGKRQHALETGRKVSQIDERYLKRAEEQLYGELAVALDMERDEVPGYIEETISSAEGAE